MGITRRRGKIEIGRKGTKIEEGKKESLKGKRPMRSCGKGFQSAVKQCNTQLRRLRAFDVCAERGERRDGNEKKGLGSRWSCSPC